MSLKELVAVSNKYGSDPEFVLAGGGNTSYKNEKDLYIKGSGKVLASVDEGGFVRMDRGKLAAVWSKSYSGTSFGAEQEIMEDIMDARGKEEHLKRPSVEVLLHDIFPQKFVLHVHPSMVNGITCSKKGEETAKSLFGDKAAWISATRPGYMLAVKAKKILNEYSECFGKALELMFIENHGVFFAADTMKELNSLVDDVMKKIEGVLKRKPAFSEVEFDRERACAIAPAVRMLTRVGDTSIVTFRTNNEVKRLVASRKAFMPLMSSYTPDHVVYCMHEPLFIQACEDIEVQYEALEKGIAGYEKASGCKPRIVAIEGLGFFGCGRTKKEADTSADMFLDVIKISVYAEFFGGSKSMSDEMISFIRDWEVETYRRKISLGEEDIKRMAEKIAIVTGGAQGFGKGIAEKLAAEGGNVVIVDLNEEDAAAVVSEIVELYGKGKSLAVQVDVANEESTRMMVERTVLEYGGVDIFINNAGINKPGGLEDMDVKTFELVNRVNYTAYFLGTKYASRPMKIQHRFAPDYYTDIIQVNSKSGISGSNKNFAYAGSKFAGIGLTQSFALELIGYNIKVNAICPGNFFESPLWSDPEKGMFIQYLKTGRVPGAKTVEDVRRAYEAKVPMGRGCRTKDVVCAVLYIVEQEYETGQAVPVTGGQQMLK